MTDIDQTIPPSPEPARSRAVFSQEDFSLLKAAIAHYARDVPEGPDVTKYANLYHRLSRIS